MIERQAVSQVQPEEAVANNTLFENAKRGELAREIRKSLYAEFRQQLVAILLDAGFTAPQVENEAWLVDDEAFDEFSSDLIIQELIKQAVERGLDVSEVGKDFE